MAKAETKQEEATPFTQNPTGKRQDLEAILSEIVIGASYNANIATAMLEKRAKKEAWLLKFLTEKFLMRACREAVRKYMQHVRRASKGQVSFDDSQESMNRFSTIAGNKSTWAKMDGRTVFIEQLAMANKERLMYFPLPIDGQPLLKDSTKVQILQGADYYLSHIKEPLKWGTFLKRVAAKLPDNNRTAGEVLKEKDLEAIEKEVEDHNGKL